MHAKKILLKIKLNLSAHQENYITLHPIIQSQHVLTPMKELISHRHGRVNVALIRLEILLLPFPTGLHFVHCL